MKRTQRKKGIREDLDAIMKDELKKKIFYSFKNEEIGSMKYFERWCPDYSVYNSSEGDEEEIETQNNDGGTKISIRNFFQGLSTKETAVSDVLLI